MDLPIGPPKPLSQLPLKGPTGARLVLGRLDAGYPEKGSTGRGRWFDDIEGTEAKIFLRAINSSGSNDGGDKWPAVVLMPEEYNLRVGGMTFTELQTQLEKYWGRGAVPGAGYQHAWVPEWVPEDTDHLCPSHEIFSCWVNRESSKWLSYFIAKNHSFGVVHAWFAAFSGVIRGSMHEFREELTSRQAIPHIEFRMSFDLCVEGFDETVNGIPSLPLDTKVTIRNGMQVIISPINNMSPRRIWDICANTVIPATWLCGHHCPLTGNFVAGTIGVTPVSHAWAANHDMEFVLTEANQQLWPIPLPRGVQLEDIRGEMIRLGVRYAWLDVLCLRQQAQPPLAKDFTVPASTEVVERREKCRYEEWKVDVPTIGAIYSNQDEKDLYGGGPTVIFMSGLGRPFRGEGWNSERHWLKRVWTLQETPALSRCLIAGLPDGVSYWDGDNNSGNLWPWDCKIDDGQPLRSAIEKAASILPEGQSVSERELADLDALLRALRGRHASNPMDRVFAIAFPFTRHESYDNKDSIFQGMTFPIYDSKTPIPIAWEQLISSIASIKMEDCDIPDLPEDEYDYVIEVSHTPTIQLLRLFPHPSNNHWFPSWAQIQQYPDVSVRDDGPVLAPEGTDYSLQITSGRVYRDCTVQLIQPPTPETKAIYSSTMDGKNAQLVATVPGIELQIDSGGRYVLIDISPDRSLWSYNEEYCTKTEIGHEHLPIWQTSVILVCEEVDILAQLVAERAAGSSTAVMRYRLRRVTTLEWDCRTSAEPGPGRWLPFKPSLVHLGSVHCSAMGGIGSIYEALFDEDSEDSEDSDEDDNKAADKAEIPTSDMFYDPKDSAGLLSRRREEWPVYKIYLV